MAMQTNTYQSRNRRRNRLGTLLILLWLLAVAGLIGYRQHIIDWWRLRGYQAPAAVSTLAANDTMTPYARKVLYVNRPQLQPKASFTDCNLGREQAAVLGCYHSNQAGIFVLQVSDSRLRGLEEVTAAHEMLHAAYDRLSSHQKRSVDAQLEAYYRHGLHDPAILAQMAGYEKTEPNDVVNEMHSVFGTEVTALPAGLEQYYKRYFSDRAAVAGYYNTYQAEFTSRAAAIKADDSQLRQLKAQIDDSQASLKTRRASLAAQQAALNATRADPAAYNAGVPAYNAAVNTYNDQIGQLGSVIARYNDLVRSRNAIALETQQLSDEITSNAAPIGN